MFICRINKNYPPIITKYSLLSRALFRCFAELLFTVYVNIVLGLSGAALKCIYFSDEMQDMCGQQLNMRWKDIYSGEVRLNSALQSRATNISVTKSMDREPGPYISKYEIASGVVLCSVTIESWDFLDRVMFYFKDVKFAPKCTEARLEIYDGPTHTSRPVSGKYKFGPVSLDTGLNYVTIKIKKKLHHWKVLAFIYMSRNFDTIAVLYYETMSLRIKVFCLYDVINAT